MLIVSAIVPVPRAPERNVLINHHHARSVEIKTVGITAFIVPPPLRTLKL
jgi:hypothetical protein